MEDVALVDFRREQNIEYAVFGIFDGHGGHQAARFAKAHLMNYIRQQKCFWSSRPENVKKAIHDGFITCHEAMRRKVPDWPKTLLGHDCTAGTTASIAIIRGNKLYVAYVGDSGIVLGYEQQDKIDASQSENLNPATHTSIGSTVGRINIPSASQIFMEKSSGPAYSATSKIRTNYFYKELTTDHKPESIAERRRIEAAGGGVAIKNGVNRVIWNRPRINVNLGITNWDRNYDKIPFLAVARSLGDLWSYNPSKKEFVVSPVPDIEVVDLVKPNEKARFIILASDGIWNMVRPWDAVHLVATFKSRKQQGRTDGSPAHDIVREALTRWRLRGLRADNSSAVVVWLDKAAGTTSTDYFNRAWSSDAGSTISYTPNSIPTCSGAPPTVLTSTESSTSTTPIIDSPLELEEEEEEQDISLDFPAISDNVEPAVYPSMNRMNRFSDLSIPQEELELISEDEEDALDAMTDDAVIALPIQEQIPTFQPTLNEVESPVQDSEVSSTSDFDTVPLQNSSSDSAVSDSLLHAETGETTCPAVIKRAPKRTSSDVDEETVSSNMGSPERMQSPKRKKSDSGLNTSSSSHNLSNSARRRSRRLIGKQNVTRSKKCPSKKQD